FMRTVRTLPAHCLSARCLPLLLCRPLGTRRRQDDLAATVRVNASAPCGAPGGVGVACSCGKRGTEAGHGCGEASISMHMPKVDVPGGAWYARVLEGMPAVSERRRCDWARLPVMRTDLPRLFPGES